MKPDQRKVEITYSDTIGITETTTQTEEEPIPQIPNTTGDKEKDQTAKYKRPNAVYNQSKKIKLKKKQTSKQKVKPWTSIQKPQMASNWRKHKYTNNH